MESIDKSSNFNLHNFVSWVSFMLNFFSNCSFIYLQSFIVLISLISSEMTPNCLGYYNNADEKQRRITNENKADVRKRQSSIFIFCSYFKSSGSIYNTTSELGCLFKMINILHLLTYVGFIFALITNKKKCFFSLNQQRVCLTVSE